MRYRSDIMDQLRELKEAIVGNCIECEGGYTLDEELNTVTCKCMIVFRYLKKLVAAEIPVEYWHLSVKDLHTVDSDLRREIVHFQRRLETAVHKALGVIFMGPNGVGKTALMCEIGKAAIVKRFRVKYFTTEQLLDAVRNDDRRYNDYLSADVILLDEVGKEYAREHSDWVAKKIEAFVRLVLSRRKVLIMGTNFTTKEFAELFGQSTHSVLRRHVSQKIVKGEDYSGQKKDWWLAELESEYEYYHPNILRMARKLHESNGED